MSKPHQNSTATMSLFMMFMNEGHVFPDADDHANDDANGDANDDDDDDDADHDGYRMQ